MPIRLHSRARIDLANIYEHTVLRWGVEQADGYVDALSEEIARIERGEAIDRSAGLPIAALRKVKYGSHNIYFRRIAQEVQIIRILHERMDPSRHLA